MRQLFSALLQEFGLRSALMVLSQGKSGVRYRQDPQCASLDAGAAAVSLPARRQLY